MTMSVTERDRLDGVVRLLDPARNAVRTSEPGSKAARALFEEVVSTSSARTELPAPLFALPAPGRRRGRTVALLVAALLVLGATGGYAASVWLSPEQQLSTIDRLAQAIPFPPGGSFDAVRAGIERDPGQMEEAGLNGALAFAATCQWYGYWLDGFNRGDEAQVSTALRTIDAIPSWPQLAASGSGPGSTVEVLRQLARSADSGSAEPVRGFLTANCDAEPWDDAANR